MAELLAELFTLESDFRPDREKQVDGLSDLLADPTGKAAVFVAEQGGEVVAMATVQMLVSTAEGGRVGLVEDVIVDREHRGRGIGTRLLDTIVAWSKERGLRRLQLLADRDNYPALDFYIKHDWCGTALVNLRKLL